MSTRTAIVTGGSAGLGRAIARDLVAHGWSVVIDARTATDLASAAAELRTTTTADDAPHAGAAADTSATVDGATADDGAGPDGDAARATDGDDTATEGTVTAIVGDVGDPTHRQALVAAAGGRIDLLVASAGTLGPTPLPRLADVRLADLDRTLRTNVVAQVGLVQEALPALRAARGVVVAVTSDAAVEAYAGWGAYGASKAAFEQVAHVLAVEEPTLAVHRLDPGDLRTRMHQDAFPGEDISDRPDPEVVAPAIRLLVERRPPSGRHRAADLLAGVGR